MVSASHLIQLPPLGKQSMAELNARAKDLGLTPEDLARQLIEDGLALLRKAETTPLAEIMAPVRRAAGRVDETEIIRLVDKARPGPRRRP
jgi:hypothetical protein